MNKIPTQPLYSLHGNTGISGSFKRDLDHTFFYLLYRQPYIVRGARLEFSISLFHYGWVGAV